MSLVITRGILGWLTSAGWEISPLVELFLVAILFGTGTDFCLFVSWRFGEHFNADNPGTKSDAAEMEKASAQLGLQFLRLPARTSDLPGALQTAARARAEALFVLDDTAFTQQRAKILRLATKHALPVVSIYKDFAEAGGLLAYGPNLPAVYRRTAYYTGRILNGAKPSELPVEEPTQFDLVVNLKTARALELSIPSSVLLSANHVIE